MKLKKILFIIAICVLSLSILIDFTMQLVDYSVMNAEYHPEISMQYLCSAILSLTGLGDLALLTVADFLCCAAAKNYSKKMFGIAIAVFSVWALRLMSMYAIAYLVTKTVWRFYYAAISIACFYVFPVLAAQLGLSIAYFRVKKKFRTPTKE